MSVDTEDQQKVREKLLGEGSDGAWRLLVPIGINSSVTMTTHGLNDEIQSNSQKVESWPWQRKRKRQGIIKGGRWRALWAAIHNSPDRSEKASLSICLRSRGEALFLRDVHRELPRSKLEYRCFMIIERFVFLVLLIGWCAIKRTCAHTHLFHLYPLLTQEVVTMYKTETLSFSHRHWRKHTRLSLQHWSYQICLKKNWIETFVT